MFACMGVHGHKYINESMRIHVYGYVQYPGAGGDAQIVRM